MSRFNELVDLAVEAAKTGILTIEELSNERLVYSMPNFRGIRDVYFDFHNETLGIIISELLCIVAESKIEKFVVETVEDVKRIKKGATIRLANGNVIVTEQYSTGLFYVNENMYWVNLDYSILKDAIIEQKGE